MSQSTDDGSLPRGALVNPDKGRDMRGIERLPSGSYRCTLRRTQVAGKKVPVESRAGSYESALFSRNDIERIDRENLEGPSGLTVAQWAKIWLGEISEAKASGGKLLSRKKSAAGSERMKLRKTEKLDLDNFRSHLKAHILESDLADMPMRAVKPAHIRKFLDWLMTRPKRPSGTVKREDLPTKVAGNKILSETTQKRVFTTLGHLFFAAKEDPQRRCRVRIDPTVGLCVLTTDEDHDDVDKWLDDDIPLAFLERQRLFNDYGDDPERWMVEAAVYIGWRQGEQWNVELRDVHLDDPEPHVWVRWGSKGLPPKNGEGRKIPLFGRGLIAMQNWLEVLKTYAPINPEGLVFPMRERITRKGKHKGGTRRRKSTVPASFKRRQKARVLGKDRDFHWHALRHTCATGLLCGDEDFGPAWELMAISKLLGHKSLQVTQMYAKFRREAVFSAAAKSRQWHEERERKEEAASASPSMPPVAAAPAEAPAVVVPVVAPAAAPVDIASVIALAVQQALQASGLTGMPQPPVAPVPPAVAMTPAAQPVEPSPTPSAPQSPPLTRTPRKGSANRRARPTVTSSGDTEGPRRSSDALTQLIDPISLAGLHAGSFSPPAGSLDGLLVAATVPLVKTRSRGATRVPADEKGLPEAHPSPEPTMDASPGAAAAASVAALAAGVAEGVPQVHPGTISEGVAGAFFGPRAAECPRSVHGDLGPSESLEKSDNTFGLRNRKSEVRIFPGAQLNQQVTAVRPVGLDTAWTPHGGDEGRPEAPAVVVQDLSLSAASTEPGWLATLQAAGTGQEPEPLRPLYPATPAVGPAVPVIPAEAPVSVSQTQCTDETSESSLPPEAPLAAKARWLMAAHARDWHTAHAIAQELAEAVLWDPAQKKNATLQRASKLVLVDPDRPRAETVELGLRLAVLVVGLTPGPKAKAKSKKSG